MKNSIASLSACAALLFSVFCAEAAHDFEISLEKDAFLLDGKPFTIRCGEIHFARVPRAYWRHRIRMCRAMGLNTVCAYIFWNYHEQERCKYDFTGEKDVAEFCRIAQEEGMWVILRPGPYSCAEWEFGGLPWWLLDKGVDKVRVRTTDPTYLTPAKKYLVRVAEELRDLQVTHGGPILMVQDENEYGFVGNDGEYLREIYRTLRGAGIDVPIFTCNPATQLKGGVIDEVFKVVNCGSNPDFAFSKLREVQPRGPLMCGEYYPSWFDTWGQRHHTKPMKAMIDDLETMLGMGGSFSLYMAYGGTSFGCWSGCNSPFLPQTTSYDYEAPISEQGCATPKFFALREMLKKYMTDEERAALPDPPAPIPLQAFVSTAKAEAATPALRLLKSGMDAPVPMEQLGVGYGAVVYVADLPTDKGGMLRVPNLRDQAVVFANGARIGFLDRRFAARGIKVAPGTRRVHLLVTHMGRYNFGTAMNNSARGLLPPVTLDGKEINHWSAFAMEPPVGGDKFHVAGHPFNFKRFRVVCPGYGEDNGGEDGQDPIPDTFLLVRGWKKGHVWVNGHPLGRFWGIGPTQTMYVPGCWLKRGENEFLIFDFGGNVPSEGLTFVDKPVLDELHPDCDFMTTPKRESAPFVPPDKPDMQGEFPDDAEAHELHMPKHKARRFAFVVDSAWPDVKDLAAIAEFEIIDSNGASVPHDLWRFVSVSSEETDRDENSAENAIDGQINNFWHSRWGNGRAMGPHYLVVDMGAEVEVAGFRYTPRQIGRNGRVRKWRFYLLQK